VFWICCFGVAILDLPFVKSRAAGRVGRLARATADAGQPTKSISPDRSGISPLSGLDAGFAVFAMPPSAPEAILRQADFKAIG
jgi:hypothetical protein